MHGTRQAVRIRAACLSLAVGSLVFGGKFAAYWVTGSTALLSDAMESIVNVVAAAVLLWCVIVAARPADRDHPYGHGKVEFFSAGIEGAFVVVAAVLILIAAARELLAGAELHRLGLGLALTVAMSVANGLLGAYLVHAGKRTHSTALVADGRHVLADVWTSVGVVLGVLSVWVTGWVVLDPIVAIAVALHILRTGWRISREAVGGLMDEADEALLRRMTADLERRREDWWIDIHALRVWRAGAFLHSDLHMVVPRYFDAERLHGINGEVRRVLTAAGDLPGDAIVHFDPCRPQHCSSCAMNDCPVRGAAFASRLPIELERATRSQAAQVQATTRAAGRDLAPRSTR